MMGCARFTGKVNTAVAYQPVVKVTVPLKMGD